MIAGLIFITAMVVLYLAGMWFLVKVIGGNGC